MGWKWRRRTILVIFAAAALYLVGNDRVGLWDRDEPRYAQTSRQMLQTPRPTGSSRACWTRSRTAKPVFIYWCQATSMRFLGVNEFAARLPSSIAMVLTLVLLAVVLHKTIGPQRAYWTVLIFASSMLVIAAAKMCITDGVLLLFVTAAQMCLCGIYLEATKRPSDEATKGGSDEAMERRSDEGFGIRNPQSAIRNLKSEIRDLKSEIRDPKFLFLPLLLWISIGLAGLTKGPVVLGVQLMTMLALAMMDVGSNWRSGRAWLAAIRWWRRTRPLLGLLILAIIVGPWLIAIECRQPGFLRQTFLHDVWNRSVKPLEGHKGPPGFYLLTIWGTFLPWCLLLPTALTLGWKNRRLGVLRFCLAAVIGPWLLWEFIQTKLVHYMLPIFPPLALLTADALVRCIRRQHDDLHRPTAKVAGLIWAVAIVIIGTLPCIAGWRFRPNPPMFHMSAAVFFAAMLIYAALFFRRLQTGQIAAAGATMGVGMMACIAILFALYLPSAQFLWLPKDVGAFLQDQRATTKGDVVMMHYKEDSLPFYQGGTIRDRDDDYLRSTPAENWPTWIVLSRELWNQQPQRVTDRLEILRSFRGLNYADKGKVVEVLVTRKISAAPPITRSP